MHKIIIFLVIFLLSKNALADFVHPMIFDEKTKKRRSVKLYHFQQKMLN